MQQPMNTNPVQVIVLTQPGITDKQSIYKNMKIGLARQLIGLGVVQLLIGILCIIFQGAAMGIFVIDGHRVVTNTVAHGFWNGLVFLITGCFGISGGMKRSRCQVIAFNVFSILSAVFAMVLTSIATVGAILYAARGANSCHRSNYGDCYLYQKAGIAMEAMMAILGLIELIIAIWSSVVCCTIGACCCSCCSCGGCCCCPKSPIQNQFMMTGQPFAGQQIMIATQQQLASNQQPQIFIHNQQPTFLPNPQQPIIGLDPRQQMAQYNPQQPIHPPFSQQSDAYTSLSPATKDRSPYIGLYTGLRNIPVAPEERAICGDRSSPYEEIFEYDYLEN